MTERANAEWNQTKKKMVGLAKSYWVHFLMKIKKKEFVKAKFIFDSWGLILTTPAEMVEHVFTTEKAQT